MIIGRPALASCVCAVLLAGLGSAHADHQNLEEGLPVEVTDAYPLGYLGREVQSRFQYRYNGNGVHESRVEPRFELGIPYNGQLAVRVPLIAVREDDDDDFDLGRAAAEYMYNFNVETLSLPAFSLAAGVEAPDTRNGGNFDPFARLLISKTLPGTTQWHRLHLNLMLQANVERDVMERKTRYVAVVGYDVRLGATVMGVLDAVRDISLDEDGEQTFGELGIRIQITPLFAFSLGAGVGATDDADLIARGTAAIQWFAF